MKHDYNDYLDLKKIFNLYTITDEIQMNKYYGSYELVKKIIILN